jgi:hypothetical protein
MQKGNKMRIKVPFAKDHLFKNILALFYKIFIIKAIKNLAKI